MAVAAEVEYAIPSRARADTLVAKTLPLLLRLGVPPPRIRVFVHPAEMPAYAEAIQAAFPGLLDLRGDGLGIRLEAGRNGMCAQRMAVQAAYPAGAAVVTIDDDMRDLVVRRNDRLLEPVDADEWQWIVRDTFQLAERAGVRLWGLYPVPNPFFMKARVRTDLCYIGGGLYGFFNRNADGALDSTLEYRDDWERSVRCYVADGAVLRLDYVSWRTEGYQGKGGMQTDGTRTREATLRDCEELVRRYPRYVTLNLTKKSGRPETRLRDPAVRAGKLSTG